MGHDSHQLPHEIAADAAAGVPPLGIGSGSHIEGAIIDKNCRIGCNVRATNVSGIENSEETPFGMIRDGTSSWPKGRPCPMVGCFVRDKGCLEGHLGVRRFAAERAFFCSVPSNYWFSCP